MSAERVIREAAAAIRARAGRQDRLDVLDRLAADFRAASKAAPTSTRTYVLALRVIDIDRIERMHAAALAMSRQQAQAAGRARAAGVQDIDTATVREWCRANGVPVPDRGRYLPAAAIDAWRDAGSPDL